MSNIPLWVAVVVTLLSVSCSLRINVGGPTIKSIVGDSKAYYGKTAGASYTWGKSPTNVYSTHRWSSGVPLIYAFSVNKGREVGIKLRFSELYKPNGKKGARVMRILVGDTLNRNGMKVVKDNFDVFALKGMYWQVDVPYKFTSKTGVVVVRIEGIKENPMLSGIDIFAWGGVRPLGNTPPTSAPNPVLRDPPAAFDKGTWNTLQTTGWVNKRHEACSVFIWGKVYLIGGRRINYVNVLDTNTKKWVTKKKSPVELNHMQCVAVPSRGKIYVVGSWYGSYPREKAHDSMYVYYPATDSWGKENALPPRRRRGSGAAAVWGNWIYLAGGNIGGHGAHATSLPWTDRYNMNTGKWEALPNMPNARDHVTGGVVGGRFCVIGGRNGGVKDFFTANTKPVNCFALSTGKWLGNKAQLPAGRAAGAVGSICDGKHMMVAGGESCRGPNWVGCQAHKEVDFYNVWTDRFVGSNNLVQGRHGSGLAIDCKCVNGKAQRKIYLPSGSGGIGGSPELTSTEVWNPASQKLDC